MDVQFIMIMTIFVWKTEKGPILPQNIDVLTQGQNVLKTHVLTRIHHHCNGPTKLLAHWQKGFENTRPTRLHHQWRISTNTRHSQRPRSKSKTSAKYAITQAIKPQP